MATTRNIQMNYFNGTDYDTLYPQTTIEQIYELQNQLDTKLSLNGGILTGPIYMNTISSENRFVTQNEINSTIGNFKIVYAGESVINYNGYENQDYYINFDPENCVMILACLNNFNCSHSATPRAELYIGPWAVFDDSPETKSYSGTLKNLWIRSDYIEVASWSMYFRGNSYVSMTGNNNEFVINNIGSSGIYVRIIPYNFDSGDNLSFSANVSFYKIFML